MKTTWQGYFKSVQEAAHAKLSGMEEVSQEWTFDATPLAGFFSLGLHRFSGTKRAWLRFRDRTNGVFYQVNDGPWGLVSGLGAETLDQILDRFIRDFQRDPRRSVREVKEASPHEMLATAA